MKLLQGAKGILDEVLGMSCSHTPLACEMLKDAKEKLDRCIGLFPGLYTAHHLLGDIAHLECENPKIILKFMGRAVSNNFSITATDQSNLFQARLGYASAFGNCGDYPSETKQLKLMLKELDNPVIKDDDQYKFAGNGVKLALGLSLKLAGNYDEASLFILQVKELFDNGVEIGEFMGKSMSRELQEQRFTLSYEIYIRAQASEKETDKLNDSWEKTEKYEKCKSEFRKAYKLTPDDPATKRAYMIIQAKLDPMLEVGVTPNGRYIKSSEGVGGLAGIDLNP